jgi:elongation factor G
VGKLSLTRVWRGEVKDGQPLDGMTVGGVFRLFGNQPQKVGRAEAGELVALGHLEKAHTGQALGPAGAHPIPWAEPLQPVYGMSLKATKAQDEVKLTGALAKLCEEDPSLQLEQRAESHELVLWGQGEIHLKVALDRLKSRFGLEVHTDRPQVPYRETIRRPVTQHGRFKHQSGGHGAFGDVHLEIRPLGRGEGFQFSESVVGGVVPRQFFGSVEKGVVDYMRQGPLGFPVVDLAVNLHHGTYHSVDSSDMAFQQAARIAMSEGMPKAEPVLLEPVVELKISVPSEHTPKAQRLVTSHRGGQILGFEGKEDWAGWDVVSAYLPMAELHDLIIELRSSTQGVGHFTWRTDHLQEVVGREADRVAQARKKALA